MTASNGQPKVYVSPISGRIFVSNVQNAATELRAEHAAYLVRVSNQTRSALNELNAVARHINAALDLTQPDHHSAPVVAALQSAYCDLMATQSSLEAALRRADAYQANVFAADARQGA